LTRWIPRDPTLRPAEGNLLPSPYVLLLLDHPSFRGLYSRQRSDLASATWLIATEPSTTWYGLASRPSWWQKIFLLQIIRIIMEKCRFRWVRKLLPLRAGSFPLMVRNHLTRPCTSKSLEILCLEGNTSRSCAKLCGTIQRFRWHFQLINTVLLFIVLSYFIYCVCFLRHFSLHHGQPKMTEPSQSRKI